MKGKITIYAKWLQETNSDYFDYETSDSKEKIIGFSETGEAAYNNGKITTLVIPKKHIESLAHMEKEDEEIVGKIYGVINKIAQEKGFKQSGYRVIVNCGKDAGQEVMQLHFHILSVEKFGDKIV